MSSKVLWFAFASLVVSEDVCERPTTLTSDPLPACPAVDSQNVIVAFRSYATAASHSDVLSDMLADYTDWSIVPRQNRATKFPTDFLLIKLADTQGSAIQSALRRRKEVKYVAKDRTVARALQEEAWENFDPLDFEKPQRFKTKNRFLYEEADQADEGVAAHKAGRKLTFVPEDAAMQKQAPLIWKDGFTGVDVKVAVFDTGIDATHPHFNNIEERSNWTDDDTVEDTLGHGSFVAGVIASKDPTCAGFAPDARIYTFRVFNSRQQSYTSWFMDAFNYAIHSKVDILNLSIGGPDWMDQPFVEKVNEMSANNIVVVSAIGNDGPLYGTLNNPADNLDVLGVGGIDKFGKLAGFSSRGMSLWELPEGYGRSKPDVVTLGKGIRGSTIKGTCRAMSGTSVASPVVAGAVTLLASVVPLKDRKTLINPASIKQIIVDSAVPTNGPHMFEQGRGDLNLLGAYELIKNYKPHASASPNHLDLSTCPYAWPYCSQGVYETSMPVIVNVTVLNPMSVSGTFVGPPRYEAKNADSDILDVTFTYPDVLWPWVGWLGIWVRVKEGNSKVERTVEGTIYFGVQPENGEPSFVELPLKINVIPTPPREKRLLWDQFHNLQYPVAYFPRDDLSVGGDALDWNGDHPHTNFHPFYKAVKDKGYFLEVLGHDFSCFDASLYSTLIIVDSEEEFFEEEAKKLEQDIKDGLSVFVMADWYHEGTIQGVAFFDDNTQSKWHAVTGGANVPALNGLLAPFGIALGDRVFTGTIDLPIGTRVKYRSGNTISRFPKGGYLYSSELVDESKGVQKKYSGLQPFLGFLQVETPEKGAGGRVAVYGDSNCIQDSTNECGGLVQAIIDFTATGNMPTWMEEKLKLKQVYQSETIKPARPLPLSINQMLLFSKVLKPNANFRCGADFKPRPPPPPPLPSDPMQVAKEVKVEGLDSLDPAQLNGVETVGDPIKSVRYVNGVATAQYFTENTTSELVVPTSQQRTFDVSWTHILLSAAVLVALLAMLFYLRTSVPKGELEGPADNLMKQRV